MEQYLPIIWAALIGTAVVLYVILDGFDLGMGILFPTTRDERERDQMMNSVAPFWDGNETWLVLGGGGLWVAFPKAYAVIMPGLYLPVIVMLLALIFRGVSFEFRWVAKPNHRLWDIAFAGGSIVAAFAQGVILGGLLEGIKVVDGSFAGGPFDWLTPFTVLCGLGLVAGYGLLGAAWLMMRTEGATAAHARRLARPLLIAVACFAVAVSLYTPYALPRIADRWFTMPNILFLWPLPLATAILGLGVWRGITRAETRTGVVMPFACTIGIFLLCFVGLVVSNFPYLVPTSMTLWEAAAAPASQIFMILGTIFLLPLILAYSVFVYWTFRDRLKEGEGYH
ncbi:cytochrome d ubiquinol oxidase subunit II [Chelatococcus reniformis]|uniref:Ubiquinol oxidase subunit II, cyanide insensitive n=1 Tax=Chelatococcus reniformis TaxID=1494448 RepID=A0A916U973_9HYPH|nr:cytochrome d ubiquinol oxidase subunit II [Chelatococcus reniformis]GGC62650.1 ubiquinol oxidase subunit II, cyanide insensitive [Chelatococcus reniformis]